MISLKWLGFFVSALVIIAIALSFTGYPKTLSKTSSMTLKAEFSALSLSLNEIKVDTTQHILKSSESFNLTTSLSLKAGRDVRIENTNFWINCYDMTNTLLDCTSAKEIDISKDTYFLFDRTYSRLTKTPLDLTLLPTSDTVSYKPEFFGINLKVKRVALVFGIDPYSRTELNLTAKPSLSIPFVIPAL